MDKYEAYEVEKSKLAALVLTSEEYERRLRELCKRLGI